MKERVKFVVTSMEKKKLFKTWDEFTDLFLKDMTAYLKLETPLTIDNFFSNTYGKVEMLDFFYR